MSIRRYLCCTVLMFIASASVSAETTSPWGPASVTDIVYKEQRVVFDVVDDDIKVLQNVLDRVSLLNNYNAGNPFVSSIVVVLHGQAIPVFAAKNYAQHKDLMTRAQSLSLSEIVHFKMCKAAAQHYFGMQPADFHGFIEMVPMADAEIVRLQQDEGHAYLR